MHTRTLRLIGIAGIASGLAFTPSANAQRASITQQICDHDGLPQLVANPVPDGGQGRVVAWRSCAPSGACVSVAADGSDGRELTPGDVAAGTTFEADVTDKHGKHHNRAEHPLAGAGDPDR